MNVSAKSAHEQAQSPRVSMTVEEARRVPWLRKDPRPLGELLDEGFLDKDRLRWAADWAYDQRLKQAAAVLLAECQAPESAPAPESKVNDQSPARPESQVSVGLSLEQARATLWPFRQFKGQRMGPLVDARLLTLRDLLFAIENAWDERVRQAAITLMLVRLGQAVKEPIPPAGPLRIVSSGKSYAEQRQRLLATVQGVLMGVALSMALAALAWSVRGMLTAPAPSKPLLEVLRTPSGAIAGFILLALCVTSCWLTGKLGDLVTSGLDKEIEAYERGQDGEDRTVEVIRQAVDGNWCLFRNVTLPGPNPADLDLVLVGPPGVWLLEVKTLSGEYRCIGDRWEYRSGKHWRPSKKNPSRQAQRNAARLASFLRADNIKQWITAVVVWANRESSLTVENPETAVWPIDRVPDELGNAWQSERISEANRMQIIEKLTTLCQEQATQSALT